MKTLFTFLFSIGIYSGINAQLTFQDTYGGTTTTEMASAVVATTTGYVVVGNTLTSSTGKDMVLFKTDLIGNLAWTKTFAGTASDIPYDMKSTVDGGFIIAGETSSFPSSVNDTSNAFLMKVDNSGNVVWSRFYGGNGRDAAYAVIETADSGFVATGFTNSFGAGNEDVLVFRVDKLGNQIWKESVGGSGSDFGRAVSANASGSAFIIAGNTNGFSAVGNIVYAVRVEGNGTLSWTKTYDFYIPSSNRQRIGYDVLVNDSNEIIIAGTIGKGSLGDAQSFAMSTDSTGGIINWCNSYIQNSGDCSTHSIEHSSDGGYLLGGTMGNYYPAIIKIDSAGNRLWDRYYSDATFSIKGFGFGATEDFNGQFITTGYSVLPATTDTSIVLIKADSTGGSYCNSFGSFFSGNTSDSVIITPVTSTTIFGGNTNSIIFPVSSTSIPTSSYCNSSVEENNSTKIQFTLFPNPMSTSTILYTEQNVFKGTQLRVFDSFGRVVMEKMITGNSTEISRGNLSNGIYFYSVILKENQVGSGKFIVE